MSLFFLHTAACVPDAGFTDLPTNDRPDGDPCECEALLECEETLDDCARCCRKKRRTSSDAYQKEAPPAYSQSYLKRQQVSRPRPTGCRRFLVTLSHLFCCCRSRRRYQLVTRYRYSKQKKPYSSISVHIEQLTSETYEEDDLAGIPDLIEVVKLQGTGPAEAARAIRKKLKYGDVHRQLRALTIFDGLLQNASQRIQRSLLNDAPLLERLRIAATDPVSDPDVRNKCKVLFSQWVASSKTNPGLEGAASLYNSLPKQKKPLSTQQRREQSRVLRETEEDVARETSEDYDEPRSRSGSAATPPNTLRKSSNAVPITLQSSSTFGMNKKDKKSKKQKGRILFNLEREKPAILQSIAASSVASTNLLNGLKLVNREQQSVSSDPEVMKRFETCKQLRRQILKYIQYVESDEFLGGLIHANEELVGALMAFEVLDKSVDDDSDSELEEAAHQSRIAKKRDEADARDAVKSLSGLSLDPAPPAKPVRPARQAAPVGLAMPMPSRPPIPGYGRRKGAQSDEEAEEEESTDVESDDDNPFGDKNAMRTPDPDASLTGERRRGYGFREV